MNKRGATTGICMLALLLLFGASTCMLVAAGYGSFNRMTILQDECLNTRVAMNYISMRMRRFDIKNAIRIDDSSPKTRLVLSEDIDGEIYETRIYLYNGYLQESFVPAATLFNEEYGLEIIPLDSFVIKRENKMIEIELSSGTNKRSIKLNLMSM